MNVASGEKPAKYRSRSCEPNASIIAAAPSSGLLGVCRSTHRASPVSASCFSLAARSPVFGSIVKSGMRSPSAGPASSASLDSP